MSKEIKHIYWFAASNLTGPSTRYRAYYPMKYLKKETNITSDFVYPSRSLNDIIKFLTTYFSILFFRKRNSIIVIQKVCSNRVYANALKILILVRKKNTVYDLDDAEHLRNNTKTLHFFLKRSETIFVGSTALLNYCKAYNNNVHILTSPVVAHNNIKKSKEKKFTIGWIGDSGNGNKSAHLFSHKKSLFEILFKNLIKINTPIKLILIGIKNQKDVEEIKFFFKNQTNIEVVIPLGLDWKNDMWVYAEIKKFDIGVSPMVNHPFTQAKSAFKAKQYLSCGVPVIANNIGENYKFVNKENGVLCDNNKEFIAAISRFINMGEKEYAVFNKNCIKTLDMFSVKNYCTTFINQLQ